MGLHDVNVLCSSGEEESGRTPPSPSTHPLHYLAASSAEAAARTGPNYWLDVLHHLSVVMRLLWKRPLLKDAMKSGSTDQMQRECGACSMTTPTSAWGRRRRERKKEQFEMNTAKLGQQRVACDATTKTTFLLLKGQIYLMLQ